METPLAARQATCVAIGDRAVLIEGPPGSGKSSLALELIDRGAVLVGDDGVLIGSRDGALVARPHPHTRGLLEVRNLGLIAFPVREGARVALAIRLDPDAPRFTEGPEELTIAGVTVPLARFTPATPQMAIKAELALARFGLGPG